MKLDIPLGSISPLWQGSVCEGVYFTAEKDIFHLEIVHLLLEAS